MIKLIVKYTVFILFVMYIFLISFPKINFYYFIEKKLQRSDILISNEEIEDNALSFIIKDAKIFYKNIKISNIDNIKIYPYLFSNQVNISNIKISSNFENFIPLNISNIDIKYNILNPIVVFLEAKGDFGTLSSQINLMDKNMLIYLSPSSLMKNNYNNILNQMKKINGQYKYEYKF